MLDCCNNLASILNNAKEDALFEELLNDLTTKEQHTEGREEMVIEMEDAGETITN